MPSSAGAYTHDDPGHEAATNATHRCRASAAAASAAIASALTTSASSAGMGSDACATASHCASSASSTYTNMYASLELERAGRARLEDRTHGSVTRAGR